MDYDRLADLFKLAYFSPAGFLPEWGGWRTIADRYRLDRRHTWPILASVASQLISDGVRPPFELDALEPAALGILMASIDGRRTACDYWTATRLNVAKASSADSLIPDQQNVDVRTSQRVFKRHRDELSPAIPDSGNGRSGMRLPADFDRLAPMARIKATRASGQASTRVDRFIHDMPQADLAKQVRGSPPVICSASNFFTSLFELREGRLFPATDQLILEWVAVFSDTSTLANYISRLQKVCFLSGLPLPG